MFMLRGFNFLVIPYIDNKAQGKSKDAFSSGGSLNGEICDPQCQDTPWFTLLYRLLSVWA